MAKKNTTGGGNGTTTTKEKAKCPVSKEQFLKEAKPLAINVDGKTLVANVKEFATGSYGWYAGEKVVVDIGGVPCKVQVGINLTLVGSKPGE